MTVPIEMLDAPRPGRGRLADWLQGGLELGQKALSPLEPVGRFLEGPGAGPAVGAWREIAGYEQLGRENRGLLARMDAILKRLDAGDESAMPEALAIQDELNRAFSESRFEAATRNPNLPRYETIGGFTQALPAIALAPGIGSGLARNLLAGAIDPAGQALGVGFEGVVGRALPAAARLLQATGEESGALGLAARRPRTGQQQMQMEMGLEPEVPTRAPPASSQQHIETMKAEYRELGEMIAKALAAGDEKEHKELTDLSAWLQGQIDEAERAALAPPKQQPPKARPETPRAKPPSLEPAPTTVDPGGLYTREGLGLDYDPSLMIQLLETQYPSDIPRTVAKELLQNAYDASRPTGTPVNVQISKPDRLITVTDRGTGMGPGMVQHVFLRIGGTSKPGGSSGGQGTAKLAFLGNAEEFYLHTVGTDEDVWIKAPDASGQLVDRLVHRGTGKLMETILVGSRNDLLARNVVLRAFPAGQMPPEIRSLLPEDMQKGLSGGRAKGTEIRVRPLSSKWGDYDNRSVDSWADFVASNLERRDPSAPAVHLTVDGGRAKRGMAGDVMAEDGGEGMRLRTPDHVGTIAVGPSGSANPTAKLDIWVSREFQDASFTTVVLVNRGQPQEASEFAAGTKSKIPRKIVVNVEPLVDSKEAGYPWTTDRRNLIPSIREQLTVYLRESLVKEAQVKGSTLAEGVLRNAGTVTDPTGAQLGRLVDASGTLKPERLNKIAGRPYVAAMIPTLRDLHDGLLAPIAGVEFSYGSGRYKYTVEPGEFLGLGMSSRWAGLNVGPNPEINVQAPQVLINPWAHFTEVQQTHPDLPPDQFAHKWAARILATMTHEIGHHAVRSDQLPYGWALSHLQGLMDETARNRLYLQLVGTLEPILRNPRWRREIERDAETVGKLPGEELLEKFSVSQPRLPEPGGGRTAPLRPPEGEGLEASRRLLAGNAGERRGPGTGLPERGGGAGPGQAGLEGPAPGGAPVAGPSPAARWVGGESGAPAPPEPWRTPLARFRGGPGRHLSAVIEALASGKPVPEEVLADYPDLLRGGGP